LKGLKFCLEASNEAKNTRCLLRAKGLAGEHEKKLRQREGLYINNKQQLSLPAILLAGQADENA